MNVTCDVVENFKLCVGKMETKYQMIIEKRNHSVSSDSTSFSKKILFNLNSDWVQFAEVLE